MKSPFLRWLDIGCDLVQVSEYSFSSFWLEWKGTKQENKLDEELIFQNLTDGFSFHPVGWDTCYILCEVLPSNTTHFCYGGFYYYFTPVTFAV